MIKMGFAGFRHGHIFSLYTKASKNNELEIAGGWEPFEEARVAAANELGVNFNFEHYEDMLKDSTIDIIAIGNYYGARGKMAIDALRAGKHVIADKPLCTSLTELDEIEKLARDKNLKVGLMLDMRYNKNAVAARKLVLEGKLGNINCIYFGGQHPLSYGVRPGWYFEQGKHGGVINDIAVHGIDLTRYITGLGISKTVGARCWNGFATEEKNFKDCAQFMAKLENGAGLIADVSYSVPDSIGYNLPLYWNFQLWGSKGLATFSASSNGVTLYKNGNKKEEIVHGVDVKSSYLTDLISDINGGENIILNTAEAIRTTRETLEVQALADRTEK